MTASELLTQTYREFNARNIDAVLATLHPEVDWPNGMEGGRVQGHEAVRAYWTRQWGMINPHVEPLGFTTDEAGRTVVEVHQVVRDLAGNLIKDAVIEHVYVIEDDLIKHMEIRES